MSEAKDETDAPYDIYNELISEARGEGGEEAEDGLAGESSSPPPLCHKKQEILFCIDEEREDLL